MLNKIDNIDDNILVARIRNNDKDAFKSLYDRYSRKIYFFSLKYLSNNIEAEELVQSVFINIWVKRESLNTECSVKSYIYKAAVNYIFNHLKKKSIHARFVESQTVEVVNPFNPTYEQIFYNDLDSSINSIVKSLPPQQQRIFQLSRHEGLANNDIALRLELSVRTVENQMYRALKTIKTALKEIYFRS